MDRKRLKFISTFMALLMFISPVSSLAMQSAVPDGQPEHCHGLEADSSSCQHEISHQASCTMEHSEEGCSSSPQCWGQASIILTLLDTHNHPKAQGHAIGQLADTNPAIHLSSLYRPPRL